MTALLEITEAEFDERVLRSPVPVLLDFFTQWCGPCKALAPTLADLSQELEGRAQIVSIDAERCPELAQRFGVTGYPTLVLMRDGEELSRPAVRSRPQLRAVLQEALGATAEPTRDVPLRVPPTIASLRDGLLALAPDAWARVGTTMASLPTPTASARDDAPELDEAEMVEVGTRLADDVEELALSRTGQSNLATAIASAAQASFDRWLRRPRVPTTWSEALRYVPAARMSPYLPAAVPSGRPADDAAAYVRSLAALEADTWQLIELENQDVFPWVEHVERVGQLPWLAAVILMQAELSRHLLPEEVVDLAWSPFDGVLDRQPVA